MKAIPPRQITPSVRFETVLAFLTFALILLSGSISPVFVQIASAQQLPETNYRLVNDCTFHYHSQQPPSLICPTAIAMNDISSSNQLIDKYWTLQKIDYSNGETIAVSQPELYTLKFISDNKVQIRADCNRARGSYTLDGDRVTIQVGPMTRVACPPESIADQYLHNLEAATTYLIQQNQLYIQLRDNAGRMVFSAI